MSLVVPSAFMLRRKKDLWAVTEDITVMARQRLRILLKRILLEDSQRTILTPAQVAQYNDVRQAALCVAYEQMRKAFREAAQLTIRHERNYSVSVGIWEHKGKFYFRPFCDLEVRTVLDFLNEDGRLLRAEYWNNTDRPDDVSAASWERRSRVWDHIAADPENVHLTIDVLSPDNFFRVFPYVSVIRELTVSGS